MSESFAIEPYLRSVSARVEAGLTGLVESRRGVAPARLVDAMKYALLGGGKRLRPALVLAACEAHGGDTSDGSLALRYALAMECLHTYSLVHDDLPAMDDDDLRRGRPTVHVAFDEATAAAGGGRAPVAGLRPPAGRPRAGRRGAGAAAGRQRAAHGGGAAAGHRGGAPAARRGRGAGADAHQDRGPAGRLGRGGGALRRRGRGRRLPRGPRFGLAFQVADDLLDLTADTATLGKRAGKDAAAGKATLPALVGPAVARARAEALLAEALDALTPLGPRAAALRALARYVIDRKK